ncbi:MAG TPA: Ni/Fe hydrogenase subunit alpha [Gammaproteobacteria bacterium]|nr:Ni/Fe hydrogenase subunit alpha [Gammaproteobacteria bacterium]
MSEQLETATNPEGLQRVVIEPLTRVEGHGKVTLLLDDDNHIRQARLHIVEFRGFEKFIQGRPYWELPVLVQRLCGICPVSHHLAAAKATDALVGATRLTPTAEKIRRLMHFGQTLQSHALHFFHLCSPDLLFGFDDAVRHRNIVGVIEDHPDIARQGVLLRKYGQEVIRVTSGKRIHGTGAIPGGVNKSLSREECDYLLKDIEQIVAWGEAAVALIKRIYFEQLDYHQAFATIDSSMLSLVRTDGAFEIYDGGLRARDVRGATIFDHVDCNDYDRYLLEGVKSWSYMKFPFIESLGAEAGWYRVGPLARVNNCDFFDTPLAERERVEFRAAGAGGAPLQATLAYHWARLIELLHCAEAIRVLLHDPDVLGDDLVVRGELQQRGIGVIEAPRGTLFHHYEIDADGIVEKANLIVSTTNNNQAMNESIRQVASHYLDGRHLTEPLLNQIEVAIRAYDPCLSCATHALGRMPLEISLLDSRGELVERLVKNSSGDIRTAD